MKNNAGSAHKADPAFLPRKNCGWQCVAVPMITSRWCGRKLPAAVVCTENNLSLEPTGKCRGTLKVYNYPKQKDDHMSALHAKVLSVDGNKTLITSANLSFHGQEGNLELGTLIESNEIAHQVDDVFTRLIFRRVFTEV